MKHAQPRHFSRRRVERISSKTASCRSSGSRIHILSRCFLGYPYQTNRIGSASTLEVFTAPPGAFNADEFIRWLRTIRSGDLIFFASARRHIDIFHCGIVVPDGGRILVRQASRSREAAVQQDLNEFLKAHQMAGVIIARPR